MKSRMISLNRLAGCFTAGFTLALAITTFPQGRAPSGPPAGAGPPPNINPKRGEMVRQVKEARLRSLDMESSAEAENQQHIQAAIINMKEDFARIQVLRNDIARNLVARKPLDYNLVTEQTAEINRRAHRLNVYMLAHAPEDKEQDSSSEGTKDQEMTKALVKLCKLIDSFTENPALKHAERIDSKDIEKVKTDKARADKDLLAILKLSESIHKTSDGLRTPK
ncbi:MAG TPA: hypothetical protein VMS31_20430 [Pyrinomonadaceae bacterium]|nr:hypothetical protein [Pyrinomonadaceae bacterium]